MQQIWPELNEDTYGSLVRDLYYKAQRANQDDLAVSAVGLALAKLLAAGKQVRLTCWAVVGGDVWGARKE
jgi:hypothetical protein